MSYRLKLTRPGGETRRLTFDAQPSWSVLRLKIADLFGIQNNAIAVSYEDSDGDTVTMSSQEELLDYFQTSYKPGQVAKLAVIDKTQSQHPIGKDTSVFVEDLDEGQDGGVPTMGPTMIFEVDDGGWQRLPRIPEMFGLHEEDVQEETGPGNAFVEVVDSDAASSKKGSGAASPEHAPKDGISTRQLRQKGKQKASPSVEATKSTSAASIVDDDFPDKPSVHVYNVPDTERSFLASMQDPSERTNQVRGPGVENLMGSFGTVYPASPPQDAFRQIPRADDLLNPADRKQFPSFATAGSELGNSTGSLSGDMPTIDLEDNSRALDGTSGSRTPTLGQTSASQASFVHDVANLVDNLTNAFASQPELSEGVRDIVRNAIGGRYWNTERERISAVAENVRVAAEETSSRITETVGSMANNAERDAVRVIAEALGGVFRVIGELSGTEPVHSSTDHPAAAPGTPQPPPQHHNESTPPRHSHHPGWNDPRAHYGRAWATPQMGDHGPAHGFGYRAPPGTRGFGTQHPAPVIPPTQQAGTWGPDPYAQHFGALVNEEPNAGAVRPNVHETKATLEAAKTVYKAEKERFRQEKEERRRLRREMTERRTEARRIQGPDGTIREEEIVARIPFHDSSRGSQSHLSRREGDGAPPRSSATTASIYAPPAQPVPYTSSNVPGTRSSVYSIADPIPPVPPAPIPAPVTTVPEVPPAPPIPPPPPIPVAPVNSIIPPVRGGSTTLAEGPVIPPQPARAVSTSGPYPWPVPPVRDPSRRKHLTTLRERIQARLFDMGITPSSQPDMLDILNTCTGRTDAPDDEEVLADVLSAMNMRGSPSPRAGGSGLHH